MAYLRYVLSVYVWAISSKCEIVISNFHPFQNEKTQSEKDYLSVIKFFDAFGKFARTKSRTVVLTEGSCTTNKSATSVLNVGLLDAQYAGSTLKWKILSLC